MINNSIKQVIEAIMCAERYTKSDALGANEFDKMYARLAAMSASYLEKDYKYLTATYCDRDCNFVLNLSKISVVYWLEE